ncbi:unnamed protein product [Chilo suppressalis]|uniref:Uncharacterized protein n=1 Tax=Chilo suppressalis TaxID=168631 RepID=A0ABN8AWE0_CHISP|nr:unnamed protein product [Chilo suppressalis]
MLDSLVRVSRRVLRVPETESSQTETRTVRDSTAATTGAPHQSPHIGRTSMTTYALRRAGRAEDACAIHNIYRPTAGRRPSRSSRQPPKGDSWAPERRLDRHRTGRDALLREKCTPSPDVDGRTPCDTTRGPITSSETHVRRGMTMNLSVPLDGVYHPLRAALSSNPTLRRVPLAAALRRYGPGTLYGKTAPFKTNLDGRRDDEKAEPPEHHISRGRDNRGIQCWAIFLPTIKLEADTISVSATTTTPPTGAHPSAGRARGRGDDVEAPLRTSSPPTATNACDRWCACINSEAIDRKKPYPSDALSGRVFKSTKSRAFAHTECFFLENSDTNTHTRTRAHVYTCSAYVARRSFNGLPGPLGQGEHADSFSVARVRPRTSKGITDLLLLNLVRLEAAGPSKKNFNTSPGRVSTDRSTTLLYRAQHPARNGSRLQTIPSPDIELRCTAPVKLPAWQCPRTGSRGSLTVTSVAATSPLYTLGTKHRAPADIIDRAPLPPNRNRADRARDETDTALRLGRSAEGRNAGPDSAPREEGIDQARHRPHPLPVQTRHAPVLRANPYSEVTDPICRLPLPTLFYRLEALHLGDLLRIWDRLTREQLLFTRNPSPRQSSRASLEYLLLPPRSAPTEAPSGLTPRPFCALRRARPTRYSIMTSRKRRLTCP